MRIYRLAVLLIGALLATPASAEIFLVKTSDGPGFASPNEALTVLEKGILPTFDALAALKAKKKILYIGFPAGSRTLYMLVDAASHDEVDRILRDLPAWGVFHWKVMAMQSLEGRAAMEREIVRALKSRE